MKYFLVLLVFGILCQNILARGLDNPVLYDLERRLVRLEARQFSESESLEHRMLQLESQLGTHQGDETLKPKLIAITKEEQHSEDTTFLQRLEKVEKNRNICLLFIKNNYMIYIKPGLKCNYKTVC